MKAPVRELDDNGSLNCEPNKRGRLERGQDPDGGPRADFAPPPDRPQSPEPWRRKTPRRAFANNIATVALPTQPDPAPIRASQPQTHSPHPAGLAFPAFRTMRALAGVIAMVAVAGVGYRWALAPPSGPPAPAAERTTNLMVSDPDLRPAAMPLAAGKTDADAARAATVGMTSMPAAPRGEASDIAFLLKSGAELMANGDVAAARLMFQHAAEAGSAEAAFALAETYDPLVFKKSGRREAVTLNVAMARSWYEKARSLGSTAAPERIVSLTQFPE